MKNRQKASGFTLIELLVVIAIIAILASLLLPGLSRAKENGRSAVCKSNLRELSLGLSLYTADYSKYPAGSTVNFDGTFFWFDAIQNYCLNQWPNGVFKCPSYKLASSSSSPNLALNGLVNGLGPFGSYGYNSSVGTVLAKWSLTPNGLPLPESAVLAPSQMILAGDAQLLGTQSFAVNGGGQQFQEVPAGNYRLDYQQGMLPQTAAKQDIYRTLIARRHGGKQNLSFCDGHIESIPYADLSKNDERIRRRWCFDNDPHTGAGYPQ